MITELVVENLRLFAGKGWRFPLSRITVLCGTNSSGKSTLLKTLLLLRQSMGIQESYQSEGCRLRFMGSQVDFGDYSSAVSHNDSGRDIVLSLTNEDAMPKAVANQLCKLRGLPAAEMTEDSDTVAYSLAATFRFRGAKDDAPSSDPLLQSATGRVHETVSGAVTGLLESAEFEISVSGHIVLTWNVVRCGNSDRRYPEFDLYLEEEFAQTVSRLRDAVEAGVRPGFVRVRVVMHHLLPQFLVVKRSVDDDDSGPEDELEREERWRVMPVPGVIGTASHRLADALSRIDYIGPLRAPAKRYYITPGDYSPPMDPSGEFLPYVLTDASERGVVYTRPGLADESREASLADALDDWMHYIRTGDKSLPTSAEEGEIGVKTTKVLTEFQVRSISGDERHSLIDSGFGYSQLLPILVRGLLADVDGMLLVEQPEVHLNPAVQVRVAEFLTAVAKVGTQVIIETHSEHILNTIRVLAAEDATGVLSSLCRLLYIDVGPEGPVKHEMSVRRDGSVPNWPRQFFGEAASLTGRLLRSRKGKLTTCDNGD